MKMKNQTRANVMSSQQSVLEMLDEPSISELGGDTASVLTKPSRSRNSGTSSPNISNSKTLKRKRDVELQDQVESAVHNLIDMAKYEMEVDPYRGIFDADDNGYFSKCSHALKRLLISKDGGDNEAVSCCPCVNRWVQDEEVKQNAIAERSRKAKNRRRSSYGLKSKARANPKNGKQGDPIPDTARNGNTEEAMIAKESEKRVLVKRNPSASFVCSCDYNPFCLASLGGVVDDFLSNGAVSGLINQNIQCKVDEDLSDVLIENWEASTSVAKGGDVEIVEPTSSADKLVEKQDSSSVDLSDGSMSNTAAICKDLQLRKMIQIDTDKIVHYLKSIILSEVEFGNIDEMVSAAQKWHRDLLYNGNGRQLKENKFGYCRPVGLRNLGATCYLNSQLQCLAANLPFVDGVFSWNAAQNDTNQMTLVISRLQAVLARMIHGPQNIACTDEFSSSMLLENNEMQDPNEFARLLFDRMHESFQQISATQLECADLRHLLPNTFRGAFTYKTTCLRCNNTSRRREDFMDLNLPIVVEKKSSKELTVERLLDEYFKPEKMEGDNKYRCENCQDICDAERAVSLDSAPPVLNIQLARYIFDLKTFRKHKLMNKILLPTSLETKSGDKIVKYLLYAVQNHRGSSAYTGHYVAEVMDWITGTWFEYDDDKVSLLQHGPNSSYDPDPDRTTRLKGGTSDAYNLFYVEESYLRDSVQTFFDKTSSSPAKGIVRMVSDDRKCSFAFQKEMVEYNQDANERLNQRRLAITSMMFSDEEKREKPEFWVEGSTLRRFFSAVDPMDDLLEKIDLPILRHKALLCEHKIGLHPRVACRGKLLTKKQFNQYSELLQMERDKLISKQNKNINTELNDTASVRAPVCDLVIQNASHLFCKRCAGTYKVDLKAKFDRYSELNYLHSILDPKSDDVISIEVDERTYAVSKAFITGLRKVALKILKPALSIDGRPTSSTDVPMKGIDHFDASNFILVQEEKEVEIVLSSTNKDCLDPKVNSKIMCDHGHCEKVNNKQTVRFVSDKTWKGICSFFPKAIAIPVTFVRGIPQSCLSCREAKECNSSFLAALMTWANADMNKSAKKKPSFDGASGYYRLVHATDIENWKKAIDVATRKQKHDTTRNQLRSILFTAAGVLNNSLSTEVLQSHRLQCIKHGKPLLSARCVREIHLQTSTNSPTAIEHSEEIPLTLVSEETYLNYVSSMLELENIVASDDSSGSSTFQYIGYHPQVTLGMTLDCEPNVDINTFFKNTPQIEGVLHFTQEPCNETACVEEFHQYFSALLPPKSQKNIEKNGKGEFIAHQEIDLIDNDHLSFVVHEFADCVDDAAAQAMVEKELSGKSDNETPTVTNLRRSSRKRNVSSNTVYAFNCKKHDNLAQFRLRIYERSNNKKIATHRLAVFVFNADSQEGTMMEILGSWNELRMEEVLKKFPLLIPFEDTIHIVLVSIGDADNIFKKGTSFDKTDIDDDSALFDVLMHIATGVDSPNNQNNGKKKRNEERGFAGTFLQSSFQQSFQNAERKDENDSASSNKPTLVFDISDDEDMDPTTAPSHKAVPEDTKDGGIEDLSQTYKDKDVMTMKTATVNRQGLVSSIMSEVYMRKVSSDSALLPIFDTKIGKEPPIPSYKGGCEQYTTQDIKGIISSAFDIHAQDMMSIVMRLQLDPAARNIFRNFGETDVDTSSRNSKNLPCSRREFDAALYFLKTKQSAAACGRLLMPYRPQNFVRSIFNALKKYSMPTEENDRYREYIHHVLSYVENVCRVEQLLCNSAPSHKAVTEDTKDDGIEDLSQRYKDKDVMTIKTATVNRQGLVSSIMSEVYMQKVSSDSALLPIFDTKIGKEPPIPSYKGGCEQYTTQDIKGIISSAFDIHAQDMMSIVMRLQLDPAARNIFRNFGETDVDTSSRNSKNLPCSRREFDAALYFLKTKQSAAACGRLLMPYRPQNFVRSIFDALKKYSMPTEDNDRYREYIHHVLSYVENVCRVEQLLCNSSADQK